MSLISEPAIVSPVPSAPTAPPAVPPVQPPEVVQMSTSALNERLERERAKAGEDLLAKLGFKSVDEALASRVPVAPAAPTPAPVAPPAAAPVNQAEELASFMLTSRWAALSPSEQTAIATVAGDSPIARLKAIEVLSPTWKSAASAAPIPPPVVLPEPRGPTAAVGQAPVPVAVSPTDHTAKHKDLSGRNPFAAAQFYLQNRSLITVG